VRQDNILNDKNIPQQKKNLVDQDKWKKKFKLFFDREKLINFDLVGSSQLFLKKGIVTNMEPVALKKTGQDIIDENIKFWILFTNYCKQKIMGDIEQREKVRR